MDGRVHHKIPDALTDFDEIWHVCAEDCIFSIFLNFVNYLMCKGTTPPKHLLIPLENCTKNGTSDVDKHLVNGSQTIPEHICENSTLLKIHVQKLCIQEEVERRFQRD